MYVSVRIKSLIGSGISNLTWQSRQQCSSCFWCKANLFYFHVECINIINDRSEWCRLVLQFTIFKQKLY